MLGYFDVNDVATDLYCDPIGDSIGEVLHQTDKDGEVRPAGFYSRNLTPPEERYSTYDRELVAGQLSTFLVSALGCSFHGTHGPQQSSMDS